MAIFSKESTFFFYLDFSERIKHYPCEVALTSNAKSYNSVAQCDLGNHRQVHKHIMSSEPKDFIFKPLGLNYI